MWWVVRGQCKFVVRRNSELEHRPFTLGLDYVCVCIANGNTFLRHHRSL